MEICYSEMTHVVWATPTTTSHRPELVGQQPQNFPCGEWLALLPTAPLAGGSPEEMPAPSQECRQSFPLGSLPSREQVPPEEAAEMSLPAACVLKESVSLGCVI